MCVYRWYGVIYPKPTAIVLRIFRLDVFEKRHECLETDRTTKNKALLDFPTLRGSMSAIWFHTGPRNVANLRITQFYYVTRPHVGNMVSYRAA